jgi:hypothetical protein
MYPAWKLISMTFGKISLRSSMAGLKKGDGRLMVTSTVVRRFD